MSYNPSIAFTPAGMDGCALWRMFLPHLNMPNSRFFFTMGQVPFDHIASSDVGCVQRMMEEGNIKYMELARTHDVRMIYDLDDNVWDMPAYNPARYAFEARREGLRNCIEWADVMTVSTNALRKHAIKEIGDLRNVVTKKPIPVVVIENYADLRLFKAHPVERDRDTIRIGWGGSNTHAGDLGYVWHMLPDLIEKHKNVELEVVGMPPPARLVGHPRVRVRNFCHVSEYWNRLATWDWDIFLAPLETNKFNKSKSGIKLIEAGAMKKPCLASYIDNYTAFAEQLPALKWLLCSVDFQWQTKLEELITNRALREELGQAMYENVKTNYNITSQVWRWDEVARMALG